MNPAIRTILRPLAMTAVAGLAFCQGELLTLLGPGGEGAWTNARFGESMDGGEDVNGDGVPDVIVGDPWRLLVSASGGLGTAEIFSGLDGSLLYQFRDDSLVAGAGETVANGGDIDGDGITDLMFSYYGVGRGNVRVLSGATGALIREHQDVGRTITRLGDTNGDGFGEYAIAHAGAAGDIVSVRSGLDGQELWSLASGSSTIDGGADLSGDGIGDLLVTTTLANGQNRVFVYSGVNGAPLFNVDGAPLVSASLRPVVRFIGDANGDGLEDFALGEMLDAVVSVYSGAGGALLFRKSRSPNSQFGAAIAPAGDLNGDGKDDVLVGAPRTGVFFVNGGYEVLSGADGSVLASNYIHQDMSEAGRSVAYAGDVDGDGIPDYAIGAPFAAGSPSGIIRITSGANQSLITSFESSYGGLLGEALQSLGDLDGDGHIELLIGNSGANFNGEASGRVTVFSPATGLTRHFDGIAPRGLGKAVALVGDLNGDGRSEIALGLPNSAVGGSVMGSVELRSGMDGSLLYLLEGTYPGGIFGASIVGSEDMDGDGVRDIIVGASLATVDGRTEAGVVQAFSGATGAFLFERKGEYADGHLGVSLSAGGDINQDGVPDVLVGGSGMSSQYRGGRIEILSGVDGSLLFYKEGTITQELGAQVAWIGDVNMDGRPDFAVSRFGTFASVVEVISGGTASVLYTTSLPGQDAYAPSVTGLGDINGDGIPDIAVGYTHAPSLQYAGGAVQVLSGIDGRQLLEYFGEVEEAYYGASITSAGDVNGDGFADLLVAAPWENVLGAVRILDGACMQVSTYCTGSLNSAGSAALISTEGFPGLSHNEFSIRVSGGVPNRPILFYYGPLQINLPFGDGMRCVGGNTQRLNPVGTFDSGGNFELQLDFTAPPLSNGPHAILPGSTWNFQGWYRDPFGPGGTGFNLTDGLSVTFCQ